MINLKVPSKYKLLATREDKVHNQIHELILGRFGIPEYKRYLILLAVGRETKWRMVLATDEVNIMKRLPQIIKHDWNEYHGRNRYDRPKQADPRQHKPNNVRRHAWQKLKTLGR